jgi:hypothetical protein
MIYQMHRGPGHVTCRLTGVVDIGGVKSRLVRSKTNVSLFNVRTAAPSPWSHNDVNVKLDYRPVVAVGRPHYTLFPTLSRRTGYSRYWPRES